MSKYTDKTLHECFHPKRGKPNLYKMPVSTKRAEQHIDKANTNLRAMTKMFENDFFDWTII